jgi:flagellar hook-associated protein 3 FlgL
LLSTESFLETARGLQEWMTATEASLNGMVDLLTAALNRALEGLSDTNPEMRPTLAQEIDGLLKEAIDAGNSKHQGSYLFAGHKVQTRPFTLVEGEPDTVTFSGDQGVILRSLSPEYAVTANLDGEATFSAGFSGMIAARDALLAGDTSALQGAITALRSALEGVSEARGLIGARQRQVSSFVEHLESTQTMLKSQLSENEDANMVEVIAELSSQETVFRAVLEVSQRTLATLNLFDLLR